MQKPARKMQLQQKTLPVSGERTT